MSFKLTPPKPTAKADPRTGKITSVSFARDIKLNHNYNSAGFHISATADVSDGSDPLKTQEMLIEFVDKQAAVQIKDTIDFLQNQQQA